MEQQPHAPEGGDQQERQAREHAAHQAWAVHVEKDQELLAQFHDLYVGSYDSPEHWARVVGSDLEWEAQLDRIVDPMLRPYVFIDYAAFAANQSAHWDIVEGPDGKTHIFMR